MFTNDATTSRVEPSKASKDKAIKAFARHERSVTKGEHDSLLAWWSMAEDAIALFGDGYGVASQYARLVHKTAKDNTEATIRLYVGAVITAMGMINTATGKRFKARDFKGIGHLRQTVKSDKKGKKPEASANPTRKVSSSDRKAYDALIASPAFKALSPNERKLIRLLASGESFSTATVFS